MSAVTGSSNARSPYIVVTIAEHALLQRECQGCQYIDCKYFLRNINTCDHYNYVKTKAYVESLKSVCNHVLAILTNYMETRLKISLKVGKFFTLPLSCRPPGRQFHIGSIEDVPTPLHFSKNL